MRAHRYNSRLPSSPSFLAAMRLSRFPISTTKETPADAQVVSHQLMPRAGYVRQLGSGLYSWMPIGLRKLTKIAAIVREEMNRAGALELLMTAVAPAEPWQEPGRRDESGAETLPLQVRLKTGFFLEA